MDLQNLKSKMIAPVPTIRTPFDSDGHIDYKGMAGIIEFLIENHVETVVLTAGDSHYLALSDKEIADVTKFVSTQVNGRVSIVAADRYFSTGHALEFAEYCKELGVDMLMLMPPDWAQSNTPDTLSSHYAEVAKVIPVMIVTNVFIPRGLEFGLETIRLSLQKSSNILSVKDDMCGVFARRLAAEFAEPIAVWAGGQKQNHMNMFPYGNCGYLSTFLTFKPETAERYWDAIQSGDLAAATGIINNIDIPFFEAVMKNAGGFDAGIHGVMEIFGLCQRWRPKPYYSLSDEELEILRNNLSEIGIL